MYIWLGINVDEQLKEVRKRAYAINDDLKFANFCYTLPFHISLKMSFEVEDSLFDKILADVEDYYSTLEPFEIAIKGIENESVIVWVRMRENDKLNKIHDDLNSLLLEKYGVGLHEYDTDYKFHTTLFMDGDTKKIDTAFDMVKDSPLPESITANRFIIGRSDSGALGTYSVSKEILR